MTELEDKATRRAKRREQQKTSNEGGEGAPEPAVTTQPDAVGASSDESGADAERAPQVEQIRDRNARLRAQAAEERRAKREREKAAVAVPIGLDASERMDDIFVRTTHAAGGWIKKNFRWLQWVMIGAAVTGVSVQTYRYMAKKKAATSTDALFVGVSAEEGVVRPAGSSEPTVRGLDAEELDPRRSFDSEQAKTTAAEQGYREAITKYGKSGAGWLARLGLAGVLYDQQKWDEALSLYRTVRSSEIAKSDPDVLGRSLEGIGLCLEGKHDRDGALQAFRELTNQEGSPTLSTLGLFHQSRVYLDKGDRDKAKELATKAKERIDKDAKDKAGKDGEQAGPSQRSGYLSESVRTLLARIDPNSVEPRSFADTMQGDPDKLQRLLESLQHKPAAPGGP